MMHDNTHRRTSHAGMPDAPRQRLVVVALLFAAAFLTIGLRTLELGLDGAGITPAVARTFTAVTETPPRADIVDRNGVLLAGNLPTQSLYAHPARVLEPDLAAERLAQVLPGRSLAVLRAQLNSSATFVWIARHLTPEKVWRVNALGIPGLHFKPDQKRVYPHGEMLAHVLGFMTDDGRPLAGVEKAFDQRLSDPAHLDAPLSLSIDLRVQHALADEIGRVMARHDAKAGAGLVLNIRSGETLALASLPAFDPNRPATAGDSTRLNRVTNGVYELGSTFKTFTLATALETGTVQLSDRIDARTPLKVGGYAIRDDHPRNRMLSVPEIYAYSSNIGASRIALEMGAQTQRDFLARLGLLSPPVYELPELAAPLTPARWRESSVATISYGHGIAVTPLQLAVATAAILNDGVLVPATLVAQSGDERSAARSVLSPATSRTMRKLMRVAVLEGTGGKADIAGYRVGGKTATAEKAVAGGYAEDALLSSFIGAFPIDDPRYLVFILIDEPKGVEATFGFAGGGWTAAPAVGRVIERIAPMLGVFPEPDQPALYQEAAMLVTEEEQAQ